MKNRVVVTGIGVINPCGNTKEETWDSLLAGKCCFTKSKYPEIAYYGVVDQKYMSLLNNREKRYMDKISHFALLTAREAVEDSGLQKNDFEEKETIISLGTAMGGMETLCYEIGESEKYDMSKITLLGMPKLLANMVSSNISIDMGIKGATFTYNSACASSTIAIGEAFKKIQNGDADIALAGGAESCLVQQVLASFGKLDALSKGEELHQMSLPFSSKRSGFVPGEGAAMLVLETYESAVKRGADIYCEIIGYGASSDAKSLVAPDLRGIERCIQNALRDAGIASNDVEYINAHGTGTNANDLTEGTAIRNIFGSKPLVSSTKSMHGHLLGAAGALEAAVCCMMMKNKLLIPQSNGETYDIDEHIGEVNVLIENAKEYEGNAVMSNSFGFGGDNASLVFNQL